MAWAAAFVAALYFVWALIVFGFTAYVVFWLDRSGWWFLLAIILFSGPAAAAGEKRDCN